MFHRILTLIDTTPGCRLALEYGVGLARQTGAELHLVGVVALPSVPGEIDELRELEENGRAALTPGYLSTYYAGYRELHALRRDAEARWGSNIKLNEFHEKLLREGAVAPKFARRLLLEK